MSSPNPASQRYRFADLTLDVGQCRVLRGDQPVALSNLSFELLRVLVEAAPNVVPHDELATRAWGPRRIVTPENLAKRVMLLRQSLGDQADQSRYIEGVRGRGYRLMPRVEVAAAEASAASRGDTPGTAHAAARRGPRLPGWSYAAFAFLGLAVVGLLVDDVRSLATRRAPTEEPRPFSFVISAPANSSFGAAPSEPSPALSPNGRELAFVAPVRSQRMLWLQTLGALEATLIAGTDGADSPFWSPDGEYVAFATQGKLKRVATRGRGAVQELSAFDGAFRGGTWASDGTIVLGVGDTLHRLAADGTTAPITALDASRGELAHRYPVFLPDGARFVYLVLASQPEHQGLYLGSLDDPDLKVRLVASAANAAIGTAADGRVSLIYLNDAGALVAQPFDASHERLTGAPVVVASQPVEPGQSLRVAAFTASGRVLAYRPRFAPPSRLVWFDRRGVRVEAAAPPEHSYRFPVLSDDGTKLVAVRDDAPEAAGLWWLDLQRRAGPERLTRGDELLPAWSNDGDRIVYSDPLPDGWGLVERPIAGHADAVSLLAGAAPAVKRVRDVTENLVVFQGNDRDLWVAPLAGERAARPLMQTPEAENHARVSPDGRWLAFSAADANETRVYVTTFPVPTERTLVGTGSDPQWRADGRELYYVAPGDVLTAVEIATEPALTIGAQSALFDARFDPQSRAFGSSYAVAPGGDRFVVAELAADAEPSLIVTQNWAEEVAARP